MKHGQRPPTIRPPQPANESFWAFIEILGKRRRAGLIEPVEWHGYSMLRVRVPASRESDDGTEEFFNLEKAIFSVKVATRDEVLDALFPLPKPAPRTCPECRNALPRFDKDGYLWCEDCSFDPEHRHYHDLCGKSHGSHGYCPYDDKGDTCEDCGEMQHEGVCDAVLAGSSI